MKIVWGNAICGIGIFILSACGVSAPTAPASTSARAAIPTSTSIPTTLSSHFAAIPQPLPDLKPAITAALRFLDSQYNAELGLLRESPDAAPFCHWLVTDNLLAAYAFDKAGRSQQAADLRKSIDGYGGAYHGRIETLDGLEVDWPPNTMVGETLLPAPVDEVIDCQEEPERVTYETRSDSIFEDWDDYTDLSLYGALNAANGGDLASARSIYAKAITRFNGAGFADKPYDAGRQDTDGNTVHYYETYKLALALYVGEVLDQPRDQRLLIALLDKQDGLTGGFVTLYDNEGLTQGDANTETTAHALLALSRLTQ